MERTNIRNVTAADLGELLDFASIDVAFISLEKVLPAVKDLLLETGEIVALIKPQFEAGRDKVGKKGVVRDASVHEEVINRVLGFSQSMGLYPIDLTYSPVKGPEGNIEYLAYLGRDEKKSGAITAEKVAAVVEESHRLL
jgi:23S rRNA (cytidine1920-2'-O)/16S rRNA (cytidine1409-2'-O)-methyltransferase